jgi:hypothetical protein
MNGSFKEKENQTTEGTFVIKYPEVIMATGNGRKVGTLSANTMAVDWNGNNSPLFFRKTN